MGSYDVLNILRIQCLGDSFEKVKLYLREAGPDGIIFDDYLKHGKWLEAHLDLRCREGGETYTFSWEHHSVLSVSIRGLEEGSAEWLGDYVMYTCWNENASTFTYQANFLISKYWASHVSREETKLQTPSSCPIVCDLA